MKLIPYFKNLTVFIILFTIAIIYHRLSGGLKDVGFDYREIVTILIAIIYPIYIAVNFFIIKRYTYRNKKKKIIDNSKGKK